MNSIEYREAESGDIEELALLLQDLFLIEKDFRVNFQKQQEGLRLLLLSEKSRIMIARINKKIVGMVTGQLVISTAEGEHSLLIEDLIVKQDYRRKGIGHQLLSRIGGWAQTNGAKRSQLLADKNNLNALSFYASERWLPTDLICLRKFHGRN